MRWSLGNVNKLRGKATQSETLRDRTRRWQRQPECSRSAIESLPVDGRRRQSPSCTGPHLKQAFPVLWSGSFTLDARLVSTALDTKCGETENRMLQWIPLARSWQHCLNALPRSCLLTETDQFDRPACNRDLLRSPGSKR